MPKTSGETKLLTLPPLPCPTLNPASCPSPHPTPICSLLLLPLSAVSSSSQPSNLPPCCSCPLKSWGPVWGPLPSPGFGPPPMHHQPLPPPSFLSALLAVAAALVSSPLTFAHSHLPLPTTGSGRYSCCRSCCYCGPSPHSLAPSLPRCPLSSPPRMARAWTTPGALLSRCSLHRCRITASSLLPPPPVLSWLSPFPAPPTHSWPGASVASTKSSK